MSTISYDPFNLRNPQNFFVLSVKLFGNRRRLTANQRFGLWRLGRRDSSGKIGGQENFRSSAKEIEMCSIWKQGGCDVWSAKIFLAAIRRSGDQENSEDKIKFIRINIALSNKYGSNFADLYVEYYNDIQSRNLNKETYKIKWKSLLNS